MICDSSISDGGWGAVLLQRHDGCRREARAGRPPYTDCISSSPRTLTPSIAYCTLGYDMIYAPGNQYTDAVLQAAAEYPEIAFALLNGAAETPAKADNGNVSSLLPNATADRLDRRRSGRPYDRDRHASPLSAAWSWTPPRASIAGYQGGRRLRGREGRQDGRATAGYRILQLLLRQRPRASSSPQSHDLPREPTCSSATLPPLTPAHVEAIDDVQRRAGQRQGIYDIGAAC